MKSYYGYDQGGGGDILKIIGLVILVIVLILGPQMANRITEDQAMERFIEMTGTEDIEIIRHSNMAILFGDPHDVTFELEIDGQRVSARCTSGTFSPMICRIYNGDDE